MNRKLFGVAIAGMLMGALIGPLVAGPGYPVIVAKWLGDGAKRDTVQFQIRIPSSGSSAQLVPGTDNANALGTSSLRFSDVQTYDVTVADDLTVTDAMTVSGTSTLQRVNFGIQLSSAPRTSATLVFNSTGTMAFNTQDGYMCVSTGSAQNSFVMLSSTATACAH